MEWQQDSCCGQKRVKEAVDEAGAVLKGTTETVDYDVCKWCMRCRTDDSIFYVILIDVAIYYTV